MAGTAHLNGAKNFPFAGKAVAIRRDDAMQPVVVEFDEHAVSDCCADHLVHVASELEDRLTRCT
jgi:hypothetical protein